MLDHGFDVLLGMLDVLWMGDGLDPDFGEAVAEGRGELFFAEITGGVHGGDQAETCLCGDCLPALPSLYTDVVALE